MATITIGRLMECDPKIDTITAYVERATLFFQANHMAEEKQVDMFLSALGPKMNACMVEKFSHPTIQYTQLMANQISLSQYI